MKKRIFSLFLALTLCLSLLPTGAWAAESQSEEETASMQQDGEADAASEPEEEPAPAALSAQAAASTEETISGNVTWDNRNITTPVVVKGDTTITLIGENTITITETAYAAALDMYSASLTIQGSGSLTVTVPERKYGIADTGYGETAGGKLTIKDGVKITTNGGQYGLSAKTIVIEGGELNLNSGFGIDTASLTMNGGTLYTTGKYGAISNSRWGKDRNINNSLTILYSDKQNANTDDMQVGTADDTIREGEVKTIYIAKMGPRASLTVGAQQGTLQEGLGRQTATFSVTGSKVQMDTLNVEWVGAHTGLTAGKSADNQTITVTADNNVKEGRYKLKLTADSEAGFSPNKATATATVTVAAAPRNPITISQQPQVQYQTSDEQMKAYVSVDASLADGVSGNITYQWYVNGAEFTGTGSTSKEITLTQSDLTTAEGKNWEYSGQVYCKLSYQGYTIDTDTVTVTINTCSHEKYTHEGKCQQCGEPCRAEVLFISEDGIPYSYEIDNSESLVGSILSSGGTFYFVRDTNATLRAGGNETNKKDATLDLQGHKVKALDLQNFPYNSVTIKNGTINGIETGAPAVLIFDSVTTDVDHFSNWCTLTVKGNCVFERQVAFHGKTQLRGGTFQNGIVDTGASPLALLADGYAFADTDSNEILNVSNVDIQNQEVKVVAHTCQYQNGKCACGRICDHADKVDSAGYCTFCHALVEAFEIGGKRYTSLENALDAAQADDTITLRGPLAIENAEPIEISKNIILNLNGFTLSKSHEKALLRILGSNVVITNGKVQSTCTSKPANAVEVGKFGHTGAKLTLDNVTLEGSTNGSGLSILTGNEAVVTSGTFPSGIYTEGTLTMSGGSADLLELGVLEGIPVTLSGGSFNSIQIWNGANYQSLLAEGYAYQKQDGALVKLSEMDENTAVTVVKCSHQDDPSGGGVCPYCGYAATVTKTDGSISYHLTADAAIAAAGGGTVKLLADAGEITISSPLKLDLNGKTAAKLTVTGDVTLASLLPEDYTFKSGSTWISDLSGTELTNVSMAKIPIKSMNYPTEMSMTYGGAGTLLVKVEKETGTGAVNFQWYKVEDGKATAVGSAATSNQFDLSAQKLSAGRHTFRFSATCDGYEKMSQDIAVTVQKANISASLITPPTAQENLTYTGREQALITAGSVTDYGTMQYSLTENGTYSQDIPTGTDAGTYTVWYRVIGDANHNDTAPASVAVSIGKKPLTITGVTAASKPYDGTTNADITSVTFDNVTLNRGTDYTVTASFDDASVGNGKNIIATVTLMEQTAKNYALEQSSFTTTGSITKAAAPDFIRETALVIINGYEKTYTVTLPALPTLETPKEYGAPTYELGEIKLNDGYYTSGAKVENGELTLPIQKNDVETTGSVGTVTVVIKSANYEDITLTVNVNATNKLVPTVTAPTANALTYNGAEQALVTAGKTTGGTMLYRLDDSEWSEQIPTAKNAGEYTVWYKVQGNAEYADVAEQSLTVTVAKKAVTVTVLDKSAYTGSTAPDLSSPEADKDYKVEGLVGADTLSGTVTLDYAQTPDMSKAGEIAINITGTLSNDNYEITYVPGTLTVSDRPSSGGGGGSSTPSVSVPVSSDYGGTKLSATISGSTATVSVSGKEIDKVIADGAKSVTVDLSGLSKVDSVKLPASVIAKTEEAEDTGLTIRLPDCAVELDEAALESIASGKTVTVSVQQAKLTDAQQEAVSALAQVAVVVDVDIVVGTVKQSAFDGGRLTISIPYTPEKGEDTSTLAVWYIRDDGSIENKGGSYDAKSGCFVFETDHLSRYLLVHTEQAIGFTDVPADAWYAGAVAWAVEQGITSGTGNGKFSPDGSCTRAQMVTFLWRVNGSPGIGTANPFSDVSSDAYYYDAVLWAVEQGITGGTGDGKFSPDAPCTRAQMATFLWRANGSPEVTGTTPFSDVSAGTYYYNAVLWAYERKITNGTGGRKFSPDATCTRAQMVQMLKNASDAA
ncbi:MAG: S-layer homology domain-containing protein [Flavonifractor plautii]|uniref:S-layer homology domain-containing protein n=1 Tax=Flavonifractor plautii TaxID=292800 RepID=UPI001898E769|nr:S-layer homology domain-containing protein [Flavonifractor plautii]